MSLQALPSSVVALMRKDVRRSVAVLCAATPTLLPVPAIMEGEVPAEAVSGAPTLLYEVFRQYDDRLILYPDHMLRYEKSLSHVYPTASVDANTKAVRVAVETLMKAHADEFPIRQNIKIVSWGPSPYECVCYYIHSRYPPDEWYTQGIRTGLLVDADRSNPNDKVVQADLRQRAAAAQKELDAFEVLLLNKGDADPLVPEGSRSNYILVSGNGKDAAVLSSEDEDILIGITLTAVQRVCGRLGIHYHKRKLRLSDVLEADAIAMLGTSVGVLPMRELVVSKGDLASLPPKCQKLFVPRGDNMAALLKPSQDNPIIQQLVEAYTSAIF